MKSLRASLPSTATTGPSTAVPTQTKREKSIQEPQSDEDELIFSSSGESVGIGMKELYENEVEQKNGEKMTIENEKTSDQGQA